MIIFAIGALICYLGRLMTIDIASKKASGAALGVVGIASYLGASIQDFVSGMMIGSGRTGGAGETVYDFSGITVFWISSAVISVLCMLTVWNAKAKE